MLSAKVNMAEAASSVLGARPSMQLLPLYGRAAAGPAATAQRPGRAVGRPSRPPSLLAKPSRWWCMPGRRTARLRVSAQQQQQQQDALWNDPKPAVTPASLNPQQVAKFTAVFNEMDVDRSGEIDTTELQRVMVLLGQTPTPAQVAQTLAQADADGNGRISFDEYMLVMAEKVAESGWSAMAEVKTADELETILRGTTFGANLAQSDMDKMLHEADEDGDAMISLAEFAKLMLPAEMWMNSEQLGGTKEGHVAPSAKSTSTHGHQAPARAKELAQKEAARWKELLADETKQSTGTSLLQLQIGLFRLLQGAAYRTFRQSFSAHHETHLRVKTLPYTFPNFVKYVRASVDMYKGLGLAADSTVSAALDALAQSVEQEEARLQERIANWDSIEKTSEMVAEAKAMEDAWTESRQAKKTLAEALWKRQNEQKTVMDFGDVVFQMSARAEMNKLRGAELQEEVTGSSVCEKTGSAPNVDRSKDPTAYLNKWNHVLLESADETINGAMVPVRYWYEDFMPKLLAALCPNPDIDSHAGVDLLQLPEDRLDAWYAQDVVEGWDRCDVHQKSLVRRAWQLTRHYLNGLQKRRERDGEGSSHRDTGFLSQYVAFIDVFLGRTDVGDANMRVSFPYFLGPATWRLFHTAAEVVCTKPLDEQKQLVEAFKGFFRVFKTMYPCPYCRHHLNAYVTLNKEVDLYPVEYLLLGWKAGTPVSHVSLEDKLATVVDGPTMRMFLWKLHNTVSSSIERTEEWYTRDEQGLYTSRFWPSLDSELARAAALRQREMTIGRLYRIYGSLKPAARLLSYKYRLAELDASGDDEGLERTAQAAAEIIVELERSETYRFDPTFVDKEPVFTPEEEEFARGGRFVVD
eukprot:jgi/Chlat1/5718/Chrsp38S05554